MDIRKILKSKIHLYCMLVIIMCSSVVSAQKVLSPWGTNIKRITGSTAPLMNSFPYTIMSNCGDGTWQYKCTNIPGRVMKFKFLVNTNVGSTNFIYELRDPREILITFGTQGRTYITNTSAGLLRITEGTNGDQYMLIEMNWEDDPDPPTGISATVDARKADIFWTHSSEIDVIGYNVYLSNNYYPYYKKVNSSFIQTNHFVITNLPLGSTNYVYVTSVDAYTNMPNYESPKSSVVQFLADRVIQVLFYLKKRRADVSDSIYIGGDTDPLDWTPSQKMTYMYNDIWYYSANFINGISIQYKYNMNMNGSQWEGGFSTSSGNREITINDSDNDGVVTINDVWGVGTIINPAPGAPTNIIAVPGNNFILLSWDRNQEIDLKAYRIYKSVKHTNSFNLVNQVTATNYTDTGVLNNTNYYYRIRAIDYNDNESGYSETVMVSPDTNAAPVVPQGLRAVPGSNIVLLSWSANPESDIQGYLIWRSQDQYSLYSNIPSIISNTSYTDSSVINDNIYYYKIQAVDTIFQTNDGFSDIVSVTPSTNPAPLAPASLEVIKTETQSIIISWTPNVEGDISGYNVYYKKENGVVKGPLYTTTAGSYTISGLENGAQYFVWITAVDSGAQEGPASYSVNAYPVPEITDLLAKSSGTETGAVLLGWTSPAEAGDLGDARRYIVKYSTNTLDSFNEFWQAPLFCDTSANVAGTIESLKVNNLGTGCPGYYYTVAAIYGDDQGIGLSTSVFQNASQLINYANGGIFRKTGSTIQVSIGSFSVPEEASAIVIRNYQDIVKMSNESFNSIMNSANEKVKNHSIIKLINNGVDNIYDISLLNSAGDALNNDIEFNNKITLYIPFNDSNHDLIVDDTVSSENILVGSLKLFWLNENISEWAIIDDSYIDYVNNYVIAKINHLTAFAPLSNPPYSDLNSAAVYPNPAYQPGKENLIVFTKLTAKVKIRIYNLAGELVKIYQKDDLTDKWLWDGMNDHNEAVASGLYIYYLEDGVNEPAKGKLAIIR